MEQVRVTYNVDKKAAIRAGRNEYGRVVQTIDVATLSPEQREALVACPVDQEGAYNLTGDVHGKTDDHSRELLVSVAEPGPDVPVRLLEARMEVQRRRDLEDARSLEVKRSALLAKTEKELTRPSLEGRLRVTIEAEDTARKFPEDAEVQAKIKAAQAYCDEQNPLIEAEEQRRKADRERKEKALVEAQEAWITAHGSDLLKARREGEYEWKDLAKKEYMNHALNMAGLPRGFKQDPDWFAKRDHPTLEEIETVRKVREALKTDGHNVLTCRLVWLHTYGGDGFMDDETEARPYDEAQAGIELDVDTPFGTAYRLLLVKDVLEHTEQAEAGAEDALAAAEGGEDA